MSARVNEIIILSNHSTHSHALGYCVPPKLRVNVTVVDIASKPLKLDYNSKTLVIIDLSSLNPDSKTLLQNQLKTKHLLLALMDNRENVAVSEITSWPNICGYINSDTGFDDICRAIQVILSGGTWFSPNIVSQLISYYRENQASEDIIVHDYKSDIFLTSREKEILSALSTSTSNREIARQLFISETTIKSHLYNIFKKLNVKNRQQAINWAKSNLIDCQLGA